MSSYLPLCSTSWPSGCLSSEATPASTCVCACTEDSPIVSGPASLAECESSSGACGEDGGSMLLLRVVRPSLVVSSVWSIELVWLKESEPAPERRNNLWPVRKDESEQGQCVMSSPMDAQNSVSVIGIEQVNRVRECSKTNYYQRFSSPLPSSQELLRLMLHFDNSKMQTKTCSVQNHVSKYINSSGIDTFNVLTQLTSNLENWNKCKLL